MRIFGRSLSSYRSALLHAPRLGRQVIRATLVFRQPLRCLTAYFLERRPSWDIVHFRDGLQISLSSHPRDIATCFVVFVKRDYGEVPADETVVDIGANIGCFSLYAARSGARRILAFEPCAESFDCLRENIRRNGLADVIVPFRVAVTKGDTHEVRFPARSNPSNRIARGLSPDATSVPATTVDEIVNRHVTGEVALMKIDCEGAEYDIVAATSPATWQRVAQLRIEYHAGRAAELIDQLTQCGFVLTYHATRRVGLEEHGDLWFERLRSATLHSRYHASTLSLPRPA